MLKFTFSILLITQFSLAAKLDLDSRRKKILDINQEELSEVSRLARQQNYKVPETLVRMAELNLEKARIYREVENEKYLGINPDKRAKLKKEDFFKNSTKYFDDANDAALVVVKKFPRYAGIGDVHYILAHNYKELGKHDLAQKYFKLAVGTAKDSKVSSKSKLALADYYFNEKKYSKAVPLYEASNNDTSDRWWTKNAFNLAWSYYRIKKYDNAIDLMNKVHKLSGGKYIDMRNQVERDIGIFYVDADRINDAITFYEKYGLRYTEQFIKIAEKITEQGRFYQAEKLLKKIKKIEKDVNKKSEILIAELSLFDKFNKTNDHLAVSRELIRIHQKIRLNKAIFEKLSFQINKKAAELQKLATSDVYKNVPKVKKQKANYAIMYFELAAELNPDLKAEKLFYQAETAFSVSKYSKALSFYIKSYDQAEIDKNKKIQSQSMEGLLSSLGQKSLSSKVASRYYVPVYSRYLKMDSNSKRANTIFVKLFNVQYDGRDITSAEKTMADFSKYFPQDYKTQEGMLAKIMEYYRTRKDYNSIKNYIVRINDGDFKISKKYEEALRLLMTKIQIEGVQQSLEKGDKSAALEGYHKIFESKESTPKAKVNAAYNLSALYFELGDAKQSLNWSSVALKDMEIKDVVKFADSFLSMAAGFFLRQQFSESSDLSVRLLEKLCKEKSSNKLVAYKNSVFISLANDSLDRSIEIRNIGKKCSIPESTITDVTLEVLKDLAKEKRWESYENMLSELESNSRNFPLLIKPLEELRKQFLSLGQLDEVKKIENKQNQFYLTSKKNKQDVPVEALDLIAEKILKRVKERKDQFDQLVFTFPESKFNSVVKAKLQILDQLTGEINSIQKIGSGRGIVEAYKYLISAYLDFGKKLQNFTPEGMSPEYIQSFKKAMSDVYAPILKNAQRQKLEIRKLIFDNKILSDSNYAVLFDDPQTNKRSIAGKDYVLMDRGGRR